MKRCWLILCFIGLAQWVGAQAYNLINFDQDKYHYGIQVGYTQSKFDIGYTEDPTIRQDLQGVTAYYNPGFHISIIGDMALNKYVSLRALPGVTLITRNMTYAWSPAYEIEHPIVDHKRTVESVYGDIPIEFKFKALRWHDFRPYITTGGSYGFDFASLRKNKNNNNESIIRLQANDLRYSAGVGFDFFLKYVKFAIELKMSFGVLDLKVPDDDLYSLAVDYMKSRTFTLSFTFEG